MLQFFYTSPDGPNTVLKDLTQSLGGFVSSNNFVNGKIEGLFPNSFSKKSREEFRLVVLSNISSDPKTITNIKIESQNSIFEYKLGLCSPADFCGNPRFESIQSDSRPLYVSPLVTEIVLPTTVEPHSHLGIWVSRKITTVTDSSSSCEEIINNLILDTDKEEELSLTINYDD